MSKIDKLSISGVRSFSPAVREAIQFNTPLTLIVGYNGSGKTTIIECLKYATTGELPPNSKGGAFIHDPKLCGEKEVMAQVKLQFRSINDRQHLTKTLDCSLVAQLDEIIPERLGVSPAILDASLWPLSEPAALKKRFDEIFEAMKYTKAIDNLKVLRKKQVEQLAHNKRMKALQSEIESSRETYKIRSIRETANTHLEIREQLEELKSTIEELHDDDASLENNLAHYEDRMNSNKSQYNELQRELAQSRKDLSGRLAEQGKHQSDKDKYERQLKMRMETYDFSGFDGELNDQLLQKLLGDKKRDLERLQKENSAELDTATSDRKRTSVLQNEAGRIDVDEGGKAILDGQLEDLETTFQTISEENDRLHQHENENEKLGRELVECTRLASDQLVDRKRKLDTLTSTWKQKLDKAIGTEWQPETLDDKFQTILKEQNKFQKQQKEMLEKIVDALQIVRDNSIVEDYPEEVSAVEQQLSLFDALVDYYNKCKRMLEAKRKCLLSASLDRLSKKIEKNLDPKGKIESVASLEKLRSVRSAFDTYERLSAKIPSLRDECKAIESEFDSLERQMEEQNSSVSDLEDMSKTVSSINQTSQQMSGGSLRSPDEIHELQASISEQMRSLKSHISKLTSDRQRMKDQLNSLELEKSELRNKISRASGQLDKKKDIQSQITSLKEEHSHQREVIQRADEDLENIEPSMNEARSARDEVLRRGRSKEQVIVEARDAVATSVNEIKMMDSDIQDYIDRGGPSNLASNQRAITNLEKGIAGTEKEITDLTVRTNQLKQDIDNGDRKKKNITDNLNYRKHLRMLEVVRQDISELEDRNADEDYERLQAEARSHENHYNRLLADRGSVMGSMKTKDEELGRLLQEWEMDYKDAKRKYRESHIRVETTKAAIEDLAQCGSAVDKAVMQFHSLKMAEINRIAGELWQSTYQGTDIDTILIRSDNESNTGKRNYNYRLCMVKQDTEMDMRGRCSAGQKVLASIIIRLALAESFGVNCGLIALDEPTTNLDRDNIKSLAESLHMIIKARQAQSNFQLIVITHDEEFLRHMRCSDFCDSFFRVKRDERQNSVISRETDILSDQKPGKPVRPVKPCSIGGYISEPFRPKPSEPEASRTNVETFLIMAALCIALFLAALDMTIITTAIPTIANEFHSSSGYIWIGSAYLLGNAAFVPTWGKISDIFGRKPVILAAAVIFWVGSLICALSRNMSMLIAARAIQGIGGGGLIVLPNIAVSDLFSMRNRGMYFGILGMVWALASAVGPILGGVFTSKVTWRWCFYINLPISGVAFFILVFFLKLHNPKTPVKEGLLAIDWAGSVLIIGGTIMWLLGLEFGGVTFPWDSATTICLIVFGILLVGLFLLYEWKVPKYPIIPPRLFYSRNSAAAYGIAFTHAFTFMSGSYWLPLYYQSVLGASSLLSGVYLLPYVLALSFVSAGSGILIRKTGMYKLVIVAGFVVLVLGFGLFIDLEPRANWAKIIVFQIIAGIGVGPNFQAPLIALQTNVEPRDIGSATSSFSFIRQLGTSISVVVGGVIFNNEMNKQYPKLERELGPELAKLLSGSNAAGSTQLVGKLTGHDGQVAKTAFWKSLQTMYIVYTCFAALGLFISLFIKQVNLSKDHKEHQTGLKSLKSNKEEKTVHVRAVDEQEKETSPN
ncbi:major facilitator superfamily-domain-containing protein [Mariannaea sp. PMI_226]|nr:major facilitator superfamily-domain-containing protein [Mariannaea sp. PMI_226]